MSSDYGAVSKGISCKVDVSILFSPLVLTTNLIFLLRCEVVLNVEGLANLLGRLALDHVGDSFATNVEKSFDVKVVGGLEIHERLLVGLKHNRQLTRIISNSIS